MTLVASRAFFGCMSLLDLEGLLHEFLYIVHLILLLQLFLDSEIVAPPLLFFSCVDFNLNRFVTILAVRSEYDTSLVCFCLFPSTGSFNSDNMLGVYAFYSGLLRSFFLLVASCN